MFPFYLEMGMTYREYWHGPAWLAKAYRTAYERRKRNEEWARHRQGAYFLQALCVALQGFGKDNGHREKYPATPWPLTKKEAREQEEQEVKERYYHMRDRLMTEAKQAHTEKQKEAIEDGKRGEH